MNSTLNDRLPHRREVTGLLKGNLKNTRIAYIRIDTILAQVLDKKLYGAGRTGTRNGAI